MCVRGISMSYRWDENDEKSSIPLYLMASTKLIMAGSTSHLAPPSNCLLCGAVYAIVHLSYNSEKVSEEEMAKESPKYNNYASDLVLLQCDAAGRGCSFMHTQ